MHRPYSPLTGQQLLYRSSSNTTCQITTAAAGSSSSCCAGGHKKPPDSARLDALLALRPAQLELQYWASQSQVYIATADVTYALLAVSFWMTFLLSKLRMGIPPLGYALAALLFTHAAVITFARRFYMRHRLVVLPTVVALVAVAMHINRKTNAPSALIQAYMEQGSSCFFMLKLVQALGLVTHLVAVTFHQLPFRLHLPLSLLSTALSINGRTVPTTEIVVDSSALLAQLHSHFAALDNGINALLNLAMPMGASLPDESPSLLLRPTYPEAPLLAIQLYLGLLLPMYIRYCLEYYSKARFLARAAASGTYTAATPAPPAYVVQAVSHIASIVLLAVLAAAMTQLLPAPLMWLARI